jgi:hypothetical protein
MKAIDRDGFVSIPKGKPVRLLIPESVLRFVWFCTEHIAGCLKHITLPRVRSLTAHGRARFLRTEGRGTQTLTK